MGLLNKLLGFRWSLYIVQNEKELIYAMHCHSVLKIVGYVMGFFADGGRPVEPWSLYLNFNHTHQNIKLGPDHFTADGEHVTQTLIRQIEFIDPGWQVGGDEPIFEEAATRKSLKISAHTTGGYIDVHAMFDSISNNKPREVTFFSVMRDVFGNH